MATRLTKEREAEIRAIVHGPDVCCACYGCTDRTEDLLEGFDALQEEIETLQKEVSIARERLGPAGYRLLDEVREYRQLGEDLRNMEHSE